MKSITTWIITGVLLAGAAVSYISKEFSDSNENHYVEHTEKSLSADVADVESETSTIKDKEGIRPEDIIHFDPKAIGKSVVERDGMVFVDLEGYGTSDNTEELKPFQKYGYLGFNGKMRFMMEPNFLYGYTFGDYDWRIVLNVHPNLVQTTGIVEFLWGWVELMEADTQAFIYFGTREDDFSQYYDECLKKNNGEDDPKIDHIAELLMTQEDSEKLGINAKLTLIRKSDGKTGMWSGTI